MRFATLALLVPLLAGCGLVDRVTMTPEERINAASPPSGTEDARLRLATLLAEFGQPAAPVMARWDDQLRARALRCSAGYKPSPLDSDDDIRAALTDRACFDEADGELLAWLHWRIAAVLLAAPPLRPVPPELPAAIGVENHILNARFADAAGVAVLHTGDEFILVDLANGEVIAKHSANAFQYVGHLSPNGRLLAAGTVKSTRFIDIATGGVMLELATTQASDLHWLDARTAITGRPRGQGSMLLDFSAGRTVPIAWMNRGVTQAMALPGQEGAFTLAYSGGISRMKLERTADEVRAVPLAELPIEGENNGWQGSFSPDGRFFLSTLPDIHEVDVHKLALTRRSLYPLQTGPFEVPGPGPGEFLISANANNGQTVSLIYSPADQSVRIANAINLQRGDYVYVRSLKTLARKDRNRLVRVDAIQTETPMSLVDLSAAALEGRWGNAVAERRDSISAAPAPFAKADAAAVPVWVDAVGIYQGSSARGIAPDVVVEVRPSGKAGRVLVLSSYEAVRWRLYGAGVGTLKAIYLSGYKESSVLGAPSTIPVKVLGSYYAYQRNDAAYGRLENAVKAEFGKGIDSFQGNYESRRFIVGP